MFKEEFDKLTASTKNIAIISHLLPDADAVSSTLSIYSYLRHKYPDKNIQIYLESEKINNFSFLEYFEKINWTTNLPKEINFNFETLIFVDGSDLKRFANRSEDIDLTNINTICIDHHPNTDEKFTLKEIDLNVSSTTELIYKLLFENFADHTNKTTALALLTGILGDTNFFRHITPAKTETLIVAKKLIEISNANLEDIFTKFTKMSQNEFQLINLLIQNTRFQHNQRNPAFMFSFLTDEQIKNYTRQEVSNATDAFKATFIRYISNYKWGFIIKPNLDNKYRVSFRSSPNSVNVSVIARHFGGGGHILAAACDIYKDDKIKTMEDIIKLLVEYFDSASLELT